MNGTEKQVETREIQEALREYDVAVSESLATVAAMRAARQSDDTPIKWYADDDRQTILLGCFDVLLKASEKLASEGTRLRDALWGE